MNQLPYRIATSQEYRDHDCCEDYSLLVGPAGWECVLGEPKDRSWFRDGEPVIDRLNKLAKDILLLTEVLKRVVFYAEGNGSYELFDELVAARDAIRKVQGPDDE